MTGQHPHGRIVSDRQLLTGSPARAPLESLAWHCPIDPLNIVLLLIAPLLFVVGVYSRLLHAPQPRTIITAKRPLIHGAIGSAAAA